MPYSRLVDEDIEYFRNLLGEKHVFSGKDISEDYSHDELGDIRVLPEVILEPGNTEEVSAIMKYAYEREIPVTPRGSGTGLCGACVPVHGGILLSTVRMDKILEIDEKNLMATVEPGVVLLNFQETVEKMGLFYPPDPGEKSATIGGNVSTNAGGMRAVKYGVTRDFVKGLEVVLPNGDILKLGGKIVKNSTGYSLLDLFVGSEGTLGIITAITVRLLPIPKKKVTLLVPFESLDMAIKTVPRIIMSKIIPTAIEFMERDVILAAQEFLGKAFPHSSAPAYLLLSFDGNSSEELESIYETVGEICLEEGADDVLIADTQDRQDLIWNTRGAFLEALKGLSELDEVDVVVPRDQIAVFINYTKELEDEFKIRIRSFGHAGDGNMHAYVLRDGMYESEWHEKLSAVMQRLYDKGFELGGFVSGEHGIGYVKRSYLKQNLGDLQMELQRRLKLVFDPKLILNPDKVI